MVDQWWLWRVQSTLMVRFPSIKLMDELRVLIGFPRPDNTALATHLESVVRVNGGIPATIGVLGGVAHVGLSTEELIELTVSAGKSTTMKVSRRDLPYILGSVTHISSRIIASLTY